MSKNSKKDFLKLLARTSVVAMTALSAGNALGAATRVTQVIDTATVTSGANLDAAVNNAAVEDIQLAHNIPSLDIVNAATSPSAIDLAGNTLTKIIGRDGASVGSIDDVGGANTTVLEVVDGATFTLNGAAAGILANPAARVYTGLNGGTIGDGSTLDINAGGAVTLTGNYDGNANNKGTIKISSATTFTGNLGAAANQQLNDINVDENLTFQGAAAQTIKTNAGITVASGKTLTADSTNGTIDIHGDVYGDLDAPGTATTLAVTGANAVTFHDKVGFNGATAKGFDAITTGAGAVKFGAAVKSTKIEANAGKVTFDGDVTGDVHLKNAASVIDIADGLTITGEIDNQTGGHDVGTVNFLGGATVTAEVGQTNRVLAVNINAAETVEFQSTVESKGVSLGNAASILKMNDDLLIDANGFTGAAAAADGGGGSIHVNDTGKTITTAGASIGTAAAGLKSIHFLGNHTLKIGASTGAGHHIAKITNTAAGNGTIETAGNFTLVGDIGFDAAGTTAQNLSAVVIKAHTLTLDGSANTANGIKLDDNAAQLIVKGADRTINKVLGNGGPRGLIEVGNGSTVTFSSVGEGTAVNNLLLEANAEVVLDGNASFDSTVANGGIHFNAAGSKLTVNTGKTLTFTDPGLNAANITAQAHGVGTLILNGQTVGCTVGAVGARLGEVRVASGDVLLSADTHTHDLNIADGATIKMNNAVAAVANNINPHLPAAAGSTAKLILDGAGNKAHTAGFVGAISEIQFAGAGNHSITVNGGLGKFDVAKVTSVAGGTRNVTIESNGNFNVPTEFSTVDGPQLTEVRVKFTAAGDHTATLKGGVINATNLHIEAPNQNNMYSLSLGTNTGNTAKKPQMILGDINGTNAGGNVPFTNIDIDGHVFLDGGVTGGGLDFITFNVANERLYLKNNIASDIQFIEDGQIHVFQGDTNLASEILVNAGQTKGCIIARSITSATAKDAFKTADGYDIDAVANSKYQDTLTLSGTVANGGRLRMVDAGKGTLVLSKAASVANIGTINAKTVKLAGAGTVYDIGTLNAISENGDVEELIIDADVTLKANSTILGTATDPLEARLTFSAGAKVLTLEDNVNINVNENGVNQVSGAGIHKLIFEGDSSVYSVLGTTGSKFDDLQVTPGVANKKVVFNKDIITVNGTKLTNANAHAEFFGNVTGKVLASAGDGHGKVTLSGDGKTIDEVGVLANNAVGTVVLNTDNAEVTGAFHAKNVSFSKDGTLTLLNTAKIATSTKTTAGDNTGTLIVQGGDHAVLNTIGTADARVKALQMGSGTSKVTLAAAVDGHNTNITTSSANFGTVSFLGASNSPKLDLGESSKYLDAVDFAGQVTLRDAYATNINVNAQNVTIRNAKGQTNLTAGGVATVTDGGYIKAKGAGTVNINAKATIDQAGVSGSALTALNVTTAGSVATINATEVHAGTFTHKTVVNAPSGLKVVGAYSADNATMNAKGFTVASGAATLDNAYTLTDSGKGTVLDLSDATAINVGNLVINTINLDANNGSALTAGRTIISHNVEFEDVDGNAFKALLDKTTITSNHPLFANVSLVANGKNATLAVENTTGSAVSKLANLTSGTKAGLESVLLAAADDNNLDFLNDIALGTFEENAKRFVSTEATEAVTVGVVDEVTSSTNELTTQRLSNAFGSGALGGGSVDSPKVSRARSELVGVAAGDAAERFGVWASALAGTARQDARKNSSPFRSNVFGALVGVDTLLDDKTMLGFAFGNAHGNVKFKDFKHGDKVKSSTWVFSGYGTRTITDNWFVRGALTAASTKVDSSEKRTGSITGTAFAKGKYSVEAFSAEAAVGYNYRTADGSTITPSAGVRLGRVNDIEYKETGAGLQNRELKHNASHSTSLIAGAQYTTTRDWDGTTITPEAHVNMRYGVGVKTPKGKFKALGTNKFGSYTGDKPSNLSVNMGASLTSHVDNIEYGLGYDLHLADKYIGHQGTVKVKLKF